MDAAVAIAVVCAAVAAAAATVGAVAPVTVAFAGGLCAIFGVVIPAKVNGLYGSTIKSPLVIIQIVK